MPPMAKKQSNQASHTFELTISQDEIKAGYQKVLKAVQAKAEIKGFRKGKAPLDVVESASDPHKLYEQVFEQVFPSHYTNYIKDHQLEPVAPPKVTVKDAKDQGDWTFDVEVALRPIVTLGAYQDAIKSTFAKDKIWTPGKDKGKEPEKPNQDQQLNQIFDNLLKTVSVQISPLLVEDETNRNLSKLLDQVNKLGLTLDQYVGSLNKTVEEIKKEQQLHAEATLKLEYILLEIAKEAKLTIADQDYQDFLGTVKNQEARDQIETNPETQAAIRYTLLKRKVIDHLLALAS
jgi:FKBP-type peptidyl-prolyl cis-trans isomerase (trigger factor)